MKFLLTLTLLSLYSLCVSAFTNPIKSRDGSDPYIVGILLYDYGIELNNLTLLDSGVLGWLLLLDQYVLFTALVVDVT